MTSHFIQLSKLMMTMMNCSVAGLRLKNDPLFGNYKLLYVNARSYQLAFVTLLQSVASDY